jgi:DNA-binding MarR family transcriptional regulator
VPAAAPLSTLLSQTLVAHTIELDNEFERRLVESGERARVTSVVMWSNFLRFVGDGIAVGELPDAAGLPRARVQSNLGGMERWRYVFVAPSRTDDPPVERRDGWGSARNLQANWIVRPAPAGLVARELWPALFGDIERRWSERFGADAVGELRSSLQSIGGGLELDLPEYVPIVASGDGMVAGFAPRPRSGGAVPVQLTALLAQALLAYTLDFEHTSELSISLSANFVRILEAEMLVRDIPESAGVSKEATSMALTALTKAGHVAVRGSTATTKRARLTAKGREAFERGPSVHAEIEAAWVDRFGADGVARLRSALDRVLAHPGLALGLRPYPTGWRASKPYLARTEALLESPRTALPHYPLVLHRGGWPDGS